MLGEPGLVGGEVDLDADALGVVEDAGVGGDVTEGAVLGVGRVWGTEDGAEAGLWWMRAGCKWETDYEACVYKSWVYIVCILQDGMDKMRLTE